MAAEMDSQSLKCGPKRDLEVSRASGGPGLLVRVEFSR